MRRNLGPESDGPLRYGCEVTTVKPKVFTYEVSIDRSGRLSAEDEPGLVEIGDEWTPDHLLLAAVVRCSIVSLEFHARRADTAVVASGSATGTVTKPEGEQCFRFVEIDVQIDAELDPRPEPAALEQLLERAERDCFVGASLISKPVYDWRVA
jgi:organic hydroperoxide reductase OsmC/OhrA